MGEQSERTFLQALSHDCVRDSITCYVIVVHYPNAHLGVEDLFDCNGKQDLVGHERDTSHAPNVSAAEYLENCSKSFVASVALRPDLYVPVTEVLNSPMILRTDREYTAPALKHPFYERARTVLIVDLSH